MPHLHCRPTWKQGPVKPDCRPEEIHFFGTATSVLTSQATNRCSIGNNISHRPEILGDLRKRQPPSRCRRTSGEQLRTEPVLFRYLTHAVDLPRAKTKCDQRLRPSIHTLHAETPRITSAARRIRSFRAPGPGITVPETGRHIAPALDALHRVPRFAGCSSWDDWTSRP